MDIPVQVQARLDGVQLGGLVAGHDLDQGALELSANNDGMKVSGRALLASIPAKLDAAMDFRAGPPNQVVQSVTVSGQPDARQLAAIGLDATPLLSGTAQVQAVLTGRRNGQGDVAVTADLTGRNCAVEALEWRKPRDAAAKATARLLLNRDQLTAIDAVQLDGDGLACAGGAGVTGGRLSRLPHGSAGARPDGRAGQLSVAGHRPDQVATSMAERSIWAAARPSDPAASCAAQRTEPPAGPSWTVDARFDRVSAGRDRVASGVALHAENDGRLVRRLRVEGRTGGAGGAFQAQMYSRRRRAALDRQLRMTPASCCAAWTTCAACRAASCRCRRNTTMRSRAGR